MVEGPGCTLNGEKIRARVQKGQKVLDVRRNETNKSSDDSTSSSFQCFMGCEFTGVETLGKELFMYFGFRALRLHFGMNGSLRINPLEKDLKGKPPVLVIQLTNDAVCFFDTTVEIRLSEDCVQRVRAMEALDICSPKFSFSQAVEAVKRESERMLCDALLDQAVLPGVGNIIKNEALFDSGLSPAVKVRQLTSEQVHHLVKMTRDFTLLFYKCRKNGSPLYKHYKVYKRPNCGQCSGTVTVCRLGDNGRMTYYCQRCQTGDPSEVNISKLPTRNSLIGWAYQGGTSSNDHVAKQEEEEWACSLCTLINRPINKYCDACMSPRPEVPKEPTKLEYSPLSRDLIRYPCNSFTKPLQEIKMNRKTAFGTTTLVLTSISAKPDSPSSPAINQAHALETMRGLSTHSNWQWKSPSNGVSGMQFKGNEPYKRESPADHTQPNKRMKTTNGLSGGSMPHIGSSSRGTQSNDTSLPTTPCCKSHHRPCTLRVVTKEGENKGRQFYTCSLPRETQCNFFEWADLHFPMCHHGKRTLMKTVLKLGPNNGRNFYTCPVKMGKQCNFFQWAENGPGISILPGC
ncbi:endonuclease 8-like 3 isoform X1 [Sinocyclocheilus grahami]|uniref:Endonuclease 8-like 3 n=1 Tax=Sinocyclocheilus grahami TaxID=75366 RepID=A0A672NRN6_SINGR|nr:PREDICTED: endonuclease 8-like 3 isoform X1 [Sinocyclocheilus grahami]